MTNNKKNSNNNNHGYNDDRNILKASSRSTPRVSAFPEAVACSTLPHSNNIWNSGRINNQALSRRQFNCQMSFDVICCTSSLISDASQTTAIPTDTWNAILRQAWHLDVHPAFHRLQCSRATSWTFWMLGQQVNTAVVWFKPLEPLWAEVADATLETFEVFTRFYLQQRYSPKREKFTVMPWFCGQLHLNVQIQLPTPARNIYNFDDLQI